MAAWKKNTKPDMNTNIIHGRYIFLFLSLHYVFYVGFRMFKQGEQWSLLHCFFLINTSIKPKQRTSNADCASFLQVGLGLSSDAFTRNYENT